MKTLNIGKDFSANPSGRYITDGEGNGESFREKVLKPMINSLSNSEKIKIILDDDVEGYGSSFLVEGFAGMVKYGYIKSEDLLAVLEFHYTNDDFSFYEDKIKKYISESNFKSEKYIPTQK